MALASGPMALASGPMALASGPMALALVLTVEALAFGLKILFSTTSLILSWLFISRLYLVAVLIQECLSSCWYTRYYLQCFVN